MNVAVDIPGDLDLLGSLRSLLATVGVRSEVREHLMSLVVFLPAPELPVCVFVVGDGRFFSWDGGRKRYAVADIAWAAFELAVIAGAQPAATARGLQREEPGS